VPEDVIGQARPGFNSHARGFEVALEAALNEASIRADQDADFARLFEEPLEVTIVYKAILKRTNPVDIDGYIAIIQIP
jgi:hypothetical protein